jgi:hypothetical protein
VLTVAVLLTVDTALAAVGSNITKKFTEPEYRQSGDER